jgi:Tol biopolymer transport system component
MKPASALAIAVLLCALSAALVFCQSGHDLFQQALVKERADGNLEEAIKLYQRIVREFAKDRALSARALVQIGQCYEKLGNAEARKAYERVVREYADQPEPTRVARERLSALTAGGGGGAGRTEVVMRRIWAAGRNYPAGISADGRHAVFVAEGAGDLWLRDLQSGEQRQITREASWAAWSFATGSGVISPDGKRFADSWRSGGCLEIRVWALDGSSTRVLRPCPSQVVERAFVSAWMPDGRRIIGYSYDAQGQTYRRYIISLVDGAIRYIGQPEREYMNWGYPSPNGRYIAWGLKGDIFVYDTTTEQDSVLVQKPPGGRVTRTVWTPDGSAIVFLSDRSGTNGLYLLGIENGRPRGDPQLLHPAADAVVGWTPDGSGILFLSFRSGTGDLYLVGIENGRPRGDPQLLRRDLGTSENLWLTRDGRLFRVENTETTDSFVVPVDEQTGKLTGTPSPVDPKYPTAWPGWSSDGKLLYYSISKGWLGTRSEVLVIRTEETGESRRVTPKPRLLLWYGPTLSPDGRRFAITGSVANSGFGVFTIDSESGDVRQLASMPTASQEVYPCQNWSPDGKAIFYKVRPERAVYIIRRKDLATGEETDVHRGIHTRDMKLSPDGTRFVYFWNAGPRKSHVLSVLDIQSGKELELWRVPEADTPELATPAWAPDGKHVLVARDLKQGTELWRFPAAGGPGEKLHSFPEQTRAFVVHPSGKRMAFMQNRSDYELWVLENFLPPLKPAAKQ